MGIIAFLVYIIFVMIWYLMLKRSIAEAMLLGLVIVCAFNGVDVLPQTFASSLTKALTQDVMAAIILFTVMASIMTQTGIITRLVNILNSILGRFRGGPAYVSACASAMFGMVSGASSANAATVGSITIPWMTESGWPKAVAATMNTGNAGLGICIPPSSSMFLMLGLPVVAGSVAAGDLYIALMCGGLWSLAYRLLLTRYYVSKYNIPAVPKDRIVSLGSALKEGGTSLTMFLGIIVPLVIITGPVGNFLKTLPAFGEDGVDAMNIIIWVPVLIMFICIIEGRKLLPKTASGWGKLLSSTAKTCCSCGAVSELAVLLMLAVGRKLLCHTESLAKGEWSKNTFLNGSFCLNGKTLGIIGAGNIGRQVAKKAQAFGAVTNYYDPFRLSPEMEAEYHLSYLPVKELLASSDLITLHVPLTEENHHMIGAEEIAGMKDHAILINTSRGGLVDDKALAEAVASGKLLGAGLDVVEEEPLPVGHPLLTNPNIIVTPHIGGGTADIGDVIMPMLAEDINTMASGNLPIHTVNKEYLKK